MSQWDAHVPQNSQVNLLHTQHMHAWFKSVKPNFRNVLLILPNSRSLNHSNTLIAHRMGLV